MHVSRLTETNDAGLRRVRDLVSPSGLVSATQPLPCAEGEPQFAIHTASLGDPSCSLDNQAAAWEHDASMGNFDGAGGALTRERATLVSIAESLERYSACAWAPDDVFFATEREVGDAAVGPRRFPQCSSAELAHPASGLAPYDPRLPIRWRRAWSLTHRREVCVPANQVYLRFPTFSRSELWTHGVSTGTAVHSDVRLAVLNGLQEVVERDSISLTWLQRLRLPALSLDGAGLGHAAAEYHRTGSSSHLDVRIFDATTDFGVPVLYALQLAEHDPHLAQVVAATCDMEPERALAKIHRELASLRIALRTHAAMSDGSPPSEGDVSVVAGAVWNGRPERRVAFDFLLDDDRTTRRWDDVPRVPDGRDPLTEAVGRLAARGAEVIAVDITTDEARQVGMHVVKVLVPEAMPLSFVHRARYLGTPRLYAAPAAMGCPVHAEPDLNHDPQPFA